MLREARIPVLNFDDCKQNLRFPGLEFSMTGKVRASYKEGQISQICKSDSGGPLLVERNNQWYVYGVTAFGDCGEDGGYLKYGVYSKTSSYMDWINQTVSEVPETVWLKSARAFGSA